MKRRSAIGVPYEEVQSLEGVMQLLKGVIQYFHTPPCKLVQNECSSRLLVQGSVLLAYVFGMRCKTEDLHTFGQ